MTVWHIHTAGYLLYSTQEVYCDLYMSTLCVACQRQKNNVTSQAWRKGLKYETTAGSGKMLNESFQLLTIYLSLNGLNIAWTILPLFGLSLREQISSHEPIDMSVHWSNVPAAVAIYITVCELKELSWRLEPSRPNLGLNTGMILLNTDTIMITNYW